MEATNVEEFPRNDTVSREIRLQEITKRMLTHLTPHPDARGVRETPARVARMWIDELTTGYRVDVAQLFRTFEDEGYGGMVVVKDNPVRSVCEHHLVPIVGYAHIAYIPDGKVVGLSKLPRLVEAYSRRLQVQERLTRQIKDAIKEFLAPAGVIVVISAEHMCMTLRGVQAPGTRTITCDVAGKFEEASLKEEFFKMIGNGGQ